MGAPAVQTGIVGYGAYVPRYRIRAEEISRVWGHDPRTGAGLNVREKSVPGVDEDVATMSVEAARQALERGGIRPQRIGAIYVGSESHPYAVKPTGTVVSEAIGAGPELMIADYEFACKAGTAAVQTCMGQAAAGMIDVGLAIGADTSQGAPGDALEYSASAAAAAILVGTKADEFLAQILHTTSYATDTPDFWRRDGQRYPSHGERFTGVPAFFKHITEASQRLMATAGTTPEDYDYAVFHQPNGKFPRSVAHKLGFTDDQIGAGMLAPEIGNSYSAAVLVGLANILDEAKKGQRVFVCGYGSGAGSDAFDLETTARLAKAQNGSTRRLREQLLHTVQLDYATYARVRGKIVTAERET